MAEDADVLTGEVVGRRYTSAEGASSLTSDPLAQRRFRRARGQKAADAAGVWREADYARGAGAVFPVLRFWQGLYHRFSTDRVQAERQDFAAVATRWEQENSPVLHPQKRSKLTAVVDGAHGWVVGYVLTESAAVLTYDGGTLAPPCTVEDVFTYASGYDVENLTKYRSRFAARILVDVNGRFVSLLGLRDVNSHRTVADWVLSSDVVLGFDNAPVILRPTDTKTFTVKNGRAASPEVDTAQIERGRRLLQGLLERAVATPTAAAEVDVLGYRGSISTLCARSGHGAPNGHRRRVHVDAETTVVEEIQRGLPPHARGTIYLASTRAVPRTSATAIFDFLGRNPSLRLIVFAPSDAAPVVNTVVASVK
jgi:hypothetical protein